jgi:hypothetical protein
MVKFKFTPEDFQNAVEWSKTVIIEENKTLYDVAKSFSSDSVEMLSFINNFKKG